MFAGELALRVGEKCVIPGEMGPHKQKRDQGQGMKIYDGMWNILNILKKLSQKAGVQTEAAEHTHSLRPVSLGSEQSS